MRLLAIPIVVSAVVYSLGTNSRGIVAVQGHQSVSRLFENLRSPDTTNDAVDRLEAQAGSDLGTKQYLAAHLPALIEAGPKYYHPSTLDSAVQYPGPVWLNAVMLARDLKLIEAAPALAKWISVKTSPITTLTTDAHLENSPAGKALVQIGEPAIPSLQEILEHKKKQTSDGTRPTPCC